MAAAHGPDRDHTGGRGGPGGAGAAPAGGVLARDPGEWQAGRRRPLLLSSASSCLSCHLASGGRTRPAGPGQGKKRVARRLNPYPLFEFSLHPRERVRVRPLILLLILLLILPPFVFPSLFFWLRPSPSTSSRSPRSCAGPSSSQSSCTSRRRALGPRCCLFSSPPPTPARKRDEAPFFCSLRPARKREMRRSPWSRAPTSRGWGSPTTPSPPPGS